MLGFSLTDSESHRLHLILYFALLVTETSVAYFVRILPKWPPIRISLFSLVKLLVVLLEGEKLTERVQLLLLKLYTLPSLNTVLVYAMHSLNEIHTLFQRLLIFQLTIELFLTNFFIIFTILGLTYLIHVHLHRHLLTGHRHLLRLRLRSQSLIYRVERFIIFLEFVGD